MRSGVAAWMEKDRKVVSPVSRFMALLYGTKITSSWSWLLNPIPMPLDFRNPTIVKGEFLMRMTWPTGSVPAPNKVSAAVCPMRATLFALRTSASVKFAPLARRHERMSM